MIASYLPSELLTEKGQVFFIFIFIMYQMIHDLLGSRIIIAIALHVIVLKGFFNHNLFI